MADKSSIEWTDATWNPITGCSVVSPGCANCYAMKLAGTRLRDHPSRRGLTDDAKTGPVWNGQVRLNEDWLTQPLRWKKPRRIFVCAHGDLFHEAVPDAWIDRVFAIMALAPRHTFQVLTKRSARMGDYVKKLIAGERWLSQQVHKLRHGDRPSRDVELIDYATPLPNVWLGVSVEDQVRADQRIPDLLATVAAVRFVSLEPLLGPIALNETWHAESALESECWGDCAWCSNGHPPLHNCRHRPSEFYASKDKSGLDWVIVGGESGPDARPMHPDWARQIRDDCVGAGVPFFFKQWGEWLPWEPEHAPHWKSQTGALIDRHEIPDLDSQTVRRWTDDCLHDGADICVHERVGKSAAGRRLDGRAWDEMPGVFA